MIECKKCILTSIDDANLKLDEKGICNHCHYYDKQEKLYLKKGVEAEELMEKTIASIKNYGKGKKYDCLIGISGGVDSSYVAYISHQKGLRALCVHFDNGWNSELAVKNIENIVNKLGFDLFTYVINWEEFKDLQLAYLRASVVDIEVLTDHAIYGAMFKIARENDIKYVLGGHNVVTEGILPYHWTYNKLDYINIKDIHNQYGTKELKTYPFLDRKMKQFIKNSGIEFVNFLNWISYTKDDVKLVLKNELNWRDYGGKHHESIWTKFYQGFILPTKFGIDKRKAHLSTLICSGQISRDVALNELKEPIYNERMLKTDMDFVLKKLELSETEFNAIMELPIRNHREFLTEGSFFNYYPILKPLHPFWKLIKKIRKTKWRSH